MVVTCGTLTAPMARVENNDSFYRVSAGVGVFWRSPIGPLRIDLGVPVIKATGDDTQIVNFSVGSRF